MPEPIYEHWYFQKAAGLVSCHAKVLASKVALNPGHDDTLETLLI